MVTQADVMGGLRVGGWGLSCQCINSHLCLSELEEFAHFDFGVWRKRYMQWISQMKSRVLDVFRGIDRDQDGRISQREFIESVLSSSECLRGWGWLLGLVHPTGIPSP